MTPPILGVEWMAGGAAGAALCFVRYRYPVIGDRTRNLALAIVVAAASGALTFVLPLAWRAGAVWFATMLLLQWSHEIVEPGRFAALRAASAAAIVFAGAWFLWR